MTPTTARRCDLCGHVGTDVDWGLMAYGEEARDRFDSGPRCHDREACRSRVEAAGEPWAVRDRGRDPAAAAIQVVAPPITPDGPDDEDLTIKVAEPAEAWFA